MGYRVRYSRDATSFIKRMSANEKRRTIEMIELLADNPDASGLDVRKMVKQPTHRLRVGKFRIIFERDDDLERIVVMTIRSRGDVYKR